MSKLGCSLVGTEHISFVSKFSSLNSPVFSDLQGYVLGTVRDFKHLREFAAWYSNFVFIKDFLESIGSQLNCLSFTDVAGMDFELVRRNCSSVKCLHLCFSQAEDLLLPRNWKFPGVFLHPFDAYPSVQSLQVFMSDLAIVEYVLTRVRNLRTLFSSNNFDSMFFEGLTHIFRGFTGGAEWQ